MFEGRGKFLEIFDPPVQICVRYLKINNIADKKQRKHRKKGRVS